MSTTAVALVDVDAMYASVEQVFRPDLRDKPLCVLSNNDGCVVTLTREAKRLGIERGQPWFQVRTNPKARSRVVGLSSNYALYGDFSARLLTLLRQHSPMVEPYSIDEAFLQVQHGSTALGERVHDQARTWLGLPVTVGLGPTKTLAKVASKLAKDRGEPVGDLIGLSTVERMRVLDGFPVDRVWGIGPRMTAKLAKFDVHTAGALARLDAGWVRRVWNVVVERTVRELAGTPCLPLELAPPPRRQLMHCRMLGTPVSEREAVAEVAHSHAQQVAAKLRRQQRATAAIQVWLSSGGSFYPDAPIDVSGAQTLLQPSNTTSELASTAARLARQLWRPGHRYRRIGVLAPDLVPEAQRPGLWANTSATGADAAISEVLDAVNTRHGRGRLGIGRAGIRDQASWAMRQQHRTPAWTTRWDELPTANAHGFPPP